MGTNVPIEYDSVRFTIRRFLECNQKLPAGISVALYEKAK